MTKNLSGEEIASEPRIAVRLTKGSSLLAAASSLGQGCAMTAARQSEIDATARDIAERQTGMPAYLVDDERWFEAVAEAEAWLANPTPRAHGPLFDGSGCGHPPDPVALRSRDGRWVCHCGWLLDPEDGQAIPEAPGPVVSCDRCGCHVAVPVAA